jgi:hypothetical protein
MRRDRDVNDATTVMGEDDQHEQQSIRHGRHHEEISGDDLIDVIGQECAQTRSSVVSLATSSRST